MRLTSSYTFPDVDAFALRVPYAALRAQRPVNVELPDTGSVADKTGHAIELGGDCVLLWL